MAEPVNIFLLFHGMVPEKTPSSPFPVYDNFWRSMTNIRRDLPGIISKRIGIQWGHEMPDGDQVRADEMLTHAQEFINGRVSYDAIRTTPGPNNVLMTGLFGRDYGIPFLRNITTRLREEIVLRGIGDVIYYTSAEGEYQVRHVVYDQALRELDAYLTETDVRFHLFGHSLGVTLTHDFLYGLFAPNRVPDFIKDKQGTPKARQRYQQWRDKAQKGELKLSSLCSAASQLPLFVLRKQELVNRLHSENLLDPSAIGIADGNRVRWKIFYDIDDILGYATRGLYYPNSSIMDIQIDCGDQPVSAHTLYWENETVIRETANVIFENAQIP